MSAIASIVSPLTPHNGTCGYCSPPGQRSVSSTNVHAAELQPLQMTCLLYQQMIDRGWRRSGTYCYKPDLKRTCCPQYTIKLDGLEFKPTKSQRKLVHKFNSFVLRGEGNEGEVQLPPPVKGGKASQQVVFDLVKAIHESEARMHTDAKPAHKFEVTLEPSSFTEEKFTLFDSYQQNIHHEEEKSRSSFTRFLVTNPLHREDIPYPSKPPEHLPRQYGAYHQMYRLDGELIAVGVIDILPYCVSSVYFMYEKKWERLSLGRISALREAALAKELHDAGLPDLHWVYMGYYIHSCPKMRYKGDYSPSYLADPEDYTWHSLEKCRPFLDKFRYACFSHPEHSVKGAYKGPRHDPQYSKRDLENVSLINSLEDGEFTVIPIPKSSKWKQDSVKRAINTTVDGLGLEVAINVIFHLAYVL